MKRETKILRMIYRELNTKAFDNTLPMCKIIYVNNKWFNWAGEFRNWDKTIVINKYWIQDKKATLKETIIHEMVHVRQMVRGLEFSHNTHFFKVLRKACKDANIRFDNRYYQAVRTLNFKV